MSTATVAAHKGLDGTVHGGLVRLTRAYILPLWPMFAVATLAAIFKAFAPLAATWSVAGMIDELNNLNRGDVTPEEARLAILRYSLVGGVWFILSILPTYWRDALSGQAVREVSRTVRCDLYSHLHRMSQVFYDRNRSGMLARRVSADVTAIEPFVSRGCVQIPMAVVVLVAVLLYFVSLNVTLAIVSMILLPIQGVAMQLVSQRTKRETVKLSALRDAQSANVQEKLAAAATVRAFVHEHREVRRYQQESEPILELDLSLSRLNGVGQVVAQSLEMLSPLTFVVVGGLMATQPGSNLTVGILLQFVFMQARISQPIAWMLNMQPIIAAASVSAGRIFEILDQRPAVQDVPGAITSPPAKGDICIDNIEFNYPGDPPLFTGLTMHIPAGSTLALVGPSGSGKSTLTALLLRFYDVTGGRILIDGHDVRDYAATTLRSSIGIVPQDPVLFSDTIAENIRFGRPGASFAEVVEAAKRAHAHDFIMALPNGYDEMLGERGINLSGGQRQRVTIARAFLKNPTIILMDEATSALDTVSERLVVRALKDLMRGRTTVLIAHRLSTVRSADKIVVLDKGRVAEVGTHASLLAKRGLYATLHNILDTSRPVRGSAS